MQLLPNKLYLAMNTAFFIAYNGSEESPVPGSAIINYCGLNTRGLETILQKLAHAKLVTSIKGAKGGYYMPQPEKTTLRDIVKTFIKTPVPDKHDFAGYSAILNENLKTAHRQWLESLGTVTFKQLCLNAKDAKLTLLKPSVLSFSI